MTPLPFQITATVLRQLADPGETHAIRVILMNTPGATVAILRGVKRKYLLTRDGNLGRHILDIPASLWAREMPTDRYRDNKSIAHDLMSKPSNLSPFVTTIVPWGTPVTVKPAVSDLFASHEPAVIIDYLRSISAPVHIIDGVERIIADREPTAASVILGYLRHAKAPDHIIDHVSAIALSPGEHLRFLTDPEDEPQIPPAPADAAAQSAPKEKSETPAAKRMREKRARDRKERDAKKAALQTA